MTFLSYRLHIPIEDPREPQTDAVTLDIKDVPAVTQQAMQQVEALFQKEGTVQ